MKSTKWMLAALSVALVAGFVSVGSVYADDIPEPPYRGRGMGAASADPIAMNLQLEDTIAHDSMLAVLAEAVGLEPAELQERIDAGETFTEIALAAGLSPDDVQVLWQTARDAALQQAIAAGIIDADQAEWLSNPGSRGAGNPVQAQTGDCDPTTATPQIRRHGNN